MKFFHLKRSRSRVHHTQRYPLYGALSMVLVIAVVLAVVWVGKDRAEGSAALARQNLATSIQSDLNAAIRAYEKVSLPTANLEDDIFPTMRQHLYAARVGNRIMEDTYKETVVDDKTLDQIESALKQVEHLRSLGQTGDADLSALGMVLAQMEADLSARFADTGLLLSRTALR